MTARTTRAKKPATSRRTSSKPTKCGGKCGLNSRGSRRTLLPVMRPSQNMREIVACARA